MTDQSGPNTPKQASGPAAPTYYVFPVIVGGDGKEDFAPPIRQASEEDAILEAMSLRAKYRGLLVVACQGPPLDSDEEEERFFSEIIAYGDVSDALRGTLPV
jgi:hypothetical protein